MILVGISGGIGCGKTTVANMLMKHVPGMIRMGFGDVVKDECASIFGFSRYLCDSARGKVTGVSTAAAHELGIEPPKVIMSVREVMQWWATDVRRAQDPLYWIKRTEERLSSVTCPVVIDDVRFPNEASLVLTRGGLLVRLQPYPGRVSQPADQHASERSLDGWEFFHHVFAPDFGRLRPVAAEIARLIGER